jgi:hypothetical protein
MEKSEFVQMLNISVTNDPVWLTCGMLPEDIHGGLLKIDIV